MNWSEFLSMGGYAFYVWGSYIVALLLMGGEVLFLYRRRKSLNQAKLGFPESSQHEKTS